MTKVVFLDMDGVVNNRRSMALLREQGKSPPNTVYGHTVDPACVLLLKDAVEWLGAHIVVSSSWRYIDDGADVLRALEWGGWSNPPVIGSTPVSMNDFRGDEVASWLNQHPEVSAYVILDDANDFHPFQLPFLVHTNFDQGLTEEHCAAMLQLFGEQDG